MKGNQEDFKFIADDKFKKETQVNGGKDVISCKFCDKKHVRSREECPAWGKNCNKCGEKNHFAVKCTKSSKASKSSRLPNKKKKRKPVHIIEEYSSSEEYFKENDNTLKFTKHVSTETSVIFS